MNDFVIKKTVQINVYKEKVWEALIRPKYTKQYMFNLESASTWEEGAAISWKGNFNGRDINRKGKVLEIRPKEFLQISDFGIGSGYEDKEENYSRIAYELSSTLSGTELKMTEDHFNNDEKRYNESIHFWDTILPKLKNLLENE